MTSQNPHACNTTLADLRIDGEVPIISNFTFHDIGTIVAAANAFIAITVSFYLIYMHATHYTKPYEQRHIIRILLMVPIYATSALLSFIYYWHSIYFHVISDCYESIAIASFFALLCHYIAPDLHEQKNFFRSIQPKDWIWPLSWFKFCCAVAWRTPRSGLTWFNIIWTGVYQYCFSRVAMTIVAVLTQYFGKYCESSQSPRFAHIWVMVIEGLAVSIAMYCLVQFYLQLRENLASHRPFLKILAIKLVIFLSFWQNFTVSIFTSPSLGLTKTSAKIAYPDLKIGVPSLLLCIEMAMFSVLHIYSFPYQPYTIKGHGNVTYSWAVSMENKLGPKQGGKFGEMAIIDALNPWDLVKAFARAIPWLFVGRKSRESDVSYKRGRNNKYEDLSMEPQSVTKQDDMSNSLDHGGNRSPISSNQRTANEEDAALIAHAQPYSQNQHVGYVPAKERYDMNGLEVSSDGSKSDIETPTTMLNAQFHQGKIQPFMSEMAGQAYLEEKRLARQQMGAPPPSQQWAKANMIIKEDEK